MCAALGLMASAAGCAALRTGETAAESESRRLAEQARAVAEQGDLPQARELLARAVAANPADAKLHRERAKLMLCDGDCRSAVEHLQFAATQAPDDPAVFVELGQAYAAEENWTAARRAAYAALEHNPRHAEALLLAADLAGRAGDDREALALYHRALKEHPHCSAARLGVALVHLRSNRLARAAPLLRAVSQDAHATPADRARAFRELGQTLVAQDRPAEAVEAFAAVVQFEQHATADDWCRLAHIQQQFGDADAARTALTQALLLAPDHEAALQLAASLETGNRPGTSPIVQAGHTVDSAR